MKKYWPYFIIFAAGFLTYFRTIFFNFTYLDDNVLIINNQAFLQNLGSIFAAFSQDVFHGFGQGAFYYRPILTISLILDAQLGGPAPFIYHVSNIFWHLAAAGLVFLLFKKLEYQEKTALFFALIFAVHPVLTQAVAWIPGRNDSILTVWILASFIAYLDKKWFWHFLFFALAMFTKENALMLPVIIFIYDYPLKNKSKIFYGWAGVISLWFLMRGQVISDTLSGSFVSNLPAVIIYLGKIIFPVNLSVLPIMQDSTFLWGIMALGIIFLLVILKKEKNWPRILFGLMWFLVFLVPAFYMPDGKTLADFIEHRVYLPIIGIFIILAELVPFKKYYFGVVAILAVITIIYSGNFSDRIAFWTSAVQTSPHDPLAHRNLGAMYYLDKNLGAAKQEYEEALALNPDEPMTHNNLGLIYMDQNDFSLAETEFKKELELYPNYDNGHYNLGLLYYKEQKTDLAKQEWQKTLEINPGFGVQSP